MLHSNTRSEVCMKSYCIRFPHERCYRCSEVNFLQGLVLVMQKSKKKISCLCPMLKEESLSLIMEERLFGVQWAQHTQWHPSGDESNGTASHLLFLCFVLAAFVRVQSNQSCRDVPKKYSDLVGPSWLPCVWHLPGAS